jgi:hypothetical protein
MAMDRRNDNLAPDATKEVFRFEPFIFRGDDDAQAGTYKAEFLPEILKIRPLIQKNLGMAAAEIVADDKLFERLSRAAQTPALPTNMEQVVDIKLQKFEALYQYLMDLDKRLQNVH